jgi:hypothetical protein
MWEGGVCGFVRGKAGPLAGRARTSLLPGWVKRFWIARINAVKAHSNAESTVYNGACCTKLWRGRSDYCDVMAAAQDVERRRAGTPSKRFSSVQLAAYAAAVGCSGPSPIYTSYQSVHTRLTACQCVVAWHHERYPNPVMSSAEDSMWGWVRVTHNFLHHTTPSM